MSMNYGPVVPEGQYPPFAVATPDDQSAWIIVAAALGLVCSLFFGGLRLLIRLTIHREFGLDDFTLGAATLLAIVQSSIILGACSKGLGKSIDILSLGAQNEVQGMYYASNLFFIIVLGLSKISVVSFLLRLSPYKHQHKLVFMGAIAVLSAWTAGSFFAVALQCNLEHAWLSVNEECTGTHLRWEIVGALDIFSEIAIVAMAVYLVWSLKSSRSSKIIVITVFSFRLLLIIAIAYRIKTFDQAGWTTNPLLLESDFISWTQGEMNYSLVSATIPAFQKFLKNMDTQFGGRGGLNPNEGSSYGYGSKSGTRVQEGSTTSYAMSKLRSMNKSTAIEEEEEGPVVRSENTQAARFVKVGAWSSAATAIDSSGSEAANAETISIGSNESRRLMIRKDVTWDIVSEDKSSNT